EKENEQTIRHQKSKKIRKEEVGRFKSRKEKIEEEGSLSQVNRQNEKNVAESLVETLLHVLGKTKDGVNARLDLLELGVKPELFVMKEEDKTTLPPA
nr:hypothetical protein [Tanacetum cinerariifolium]